MFAKFEKGEGYVGMQNLLTSHFQELNVLIHEQFILKHNRSKSERIVDKSFLQFDTEVNMQIILINPFGVNSLISSFSLPTFFLQGMLDLAQNCEP